MNAIIGHWHEMIRITTLILWPLGCLLAIEVVEYLM
jgi:K+-transporting ATPase A subunit